MSQKHIIRGCHLRPWQNIFISLALRSAMRGSDQKRKFNLRKLCFVSDWYPQTFMEYTARFWHISAIFASRIQSSAYESKLLRSTAKDPRPQAAQLRTPQYLQLCSVIILTSQQHWELQSEPGFQSFPPPSPTAGSKAIFKAIDIFPTFPQEDQKMKIFKIQTFFNFLLAEQIPDAVLSWSTM